MNATMAFCASQASTFYIHTSTFTMFTWERQLELNRLSLDSYMPNDTKWNLLFISIGADDYQALTATVNRSVVVTIKLNFLSCDSFNDSFSRTAKIDCDRVQSQLVAIKITNHRTSVH